VQGDVIPNSPRDPFVEEFLVALDVMRIILVDLEGIIGSELE
jgi:hypothetical protein